MKQLNNNANNMFISQGKIGVVYVVDRASMGKQKADFFEIAKIRTKNTPMEQQDVMRVIDLFIHHARLLPFRYRGVFDKSLDIFYAEYRSLEEIRNLCVLLKLREFPIVCGLKLDNGSLIEMGRVSELLGISDDIYSPLLNLEDKFISIRDNSSSNGQPVSICNETCEAFNHLRQQYSSQDQYLRENLKVLIARVVIADFCSATSR